MQSARNWIADEGVTVAIFFTVAVAAVLAFGFGATADIVVSILVVGVTTAFSEVRLRARK
jgi:hypothetical protein